MEDKYSKIVTSMIEIDNQQKSYGNPKCGSYATTKLGLVDITDSIREFDYANAVDQAGEDSTKITAKMYIVLACVCIEAVANTVGMSIRFSNNGILVFNGMYWEIKSETEFKLFLANAVRETGAPILMVSHYKFVDDLYKQYASMTTYTMKPNNDSLIKLNLKNGTLVLDKFGNETLKNFDRFDLLTYQLDFNYDPSASSVVFNKFLSEVIPYQALQDNLSEYLGYVLIPNSSSVFKAEKIAVLLGEGANGKSVIYEIVTALFGSNNVTHYSLESITAPGSYQASALENKILNYGSDISEKFDLANFKILASGEAYPVRSIYSAPTIMTNYCKFIFNANFLQKNIVDPAFMRRIIIIPFNITIPKHKQDKQLHTKIIATELPGILNWILAGLKRLLAQGDFTQSDSIDDVLAKYHTESDSVQLFVDELNLFPSTDKKMSLKNIYQKYKDYCKDASYKFINRSQFKKSLESKGFTTARHGHGNIIYMVQVKQN